MGLADKVIEANERQQEKYKVDELGLGIANTTDYIVARALYRNTLELEENPEAGLLHTRNHGSELWKGKTKLKKTKSTLYELSRSNRNLKDYEIEAIWESLLKNTPELDDTKIAIDEYTYWDIETGELCHSKEGVLTI